MEGCTTDWITTAINDLPTIVDVVTSVASIVAAALGAAGIAPAVAAIIATAAQAAQVALALLQQLIKDYQANPSASVLAQIKTTLLDVQAQLGAILNAAHIDNLVLRATITFVVGTGVTVLTDILSLLPASTTTSLAKSAAATAKFAVKPLNANQIKSQVNNYLNGNGYGAYVI
jgi:hypothetical protein